MFYGGAFRQNITTRNDFWKLTTPQLPKTFFRPRHQLKRCGDRVKVRQRVFLLTKIRRKGDTKVTQLKNGNFQKNFFFFVSHYNFELFIG